MNLEGTFEWVKAYEPEEFSGDTRFVCSFYPANEVEWAKFEKAGLQQEPKEGTDGKKFVRFRRSARKVFPKDDEATYFTPPEVNGAVNVTYVNAETGQRIRSFKKSEKIEVRAIGEKVPIGNGSKGIINLSIYPTGQGVGHRWESITIRDLVVFTPREEGQEEQAQEAAPEPEEKKPAPKGKKGTVKEDMNDDIPW